MMNRLIDDLRDITSIEAGHLSIVRRAGDPSAIVRDAVDATQDAAEAKGLPGRAPIADCDRFRIIQVLAIAKGIVEAHGGTIAVASRRGLGTTFSLTIPNARARE